MRNAILPWHMSHCYDGTEIVGVLQLIGNSPVHSRTMSSVQAAYNTRDGLEEELCTTVELWNR